MPRGTWKRVTTVATGTGSSLGKRAWRRSWTLFSSDRPETSPTTGRRRASTRPAARASFLGAAMGAVPWSSVLSVSASVRTMLAVKQGTVCPKPHCLNDLFLWLWLLRSVPEVGPWDVCCRDACSGELCWALCSFVGEGNPSFQSGLVRFSLSHASCESQDSDSVY